MIAKGQTKQIVVNNAEYEALARIVANATKLGIGAFERDLLQQLLGKM